MWPIGEFDRIGVWLESRLAKALRLNTFRFDGRKIIKYRGLRQDVVALADVVDWSVSSEMGFDVVHIRLNDGRSVRWIDTRDDLLEILIREAGERRKKENGV